MIAGLLVVIPLYCVGVLAAFWAARFGTTVLYGQSTGVYDHYFRTFLNPTDLIWSFVQCIAMAVVIMLVHTYYGFTARGGPAGVGEAVGRAVRTSLIVVGVRARDDLAGRLRPVRQLQPGRVDAWTTRRRRPAPRVVDADPAWSSSPSLMWLTYALFTGTLRSRTCRSR